MADVKATSKFMGPLPGRRSVLYECSYLAKFVMGSRYLDPNIKGRKQGEIFICLIAPLKTVVPCICGIRLAYFSNSMTKNLLLVDIVWASNLVWARITISFLTKLASLVSYWHSFTRKV